MQTQQNTNEELLLSIIIPAYNCESYIAECLDSILSDMPESVEVIVVDDGSQDGTVKVLQSLEGRSDRLKIYCNSHKGSSGARNAGIELASGRYITFLDCDDCIRKGFLKEGLKLLDIKADLYIFGIERMYKSGEKELWTVPDRYYPDAGSFADEYIRVRQLLVYSNCNKFYRRDIVNEHGIRFDETRVFGEDRLFNFDYLNVCGSVITSAAIMLCYLQRMDISQSNAHIPNYFKQILELHRAKIDCICTLSKGTDIDEKVDFVAYDLSREVERAVDRFSEHPEEEEENLPFINRLIFGKLQKIDKPCDVLLVLGSTNCDYRVERALEVGKTYPGVKYVLSGGNPHACGTLTEAEFMADYLKKNGVPVDSFILENRATYTFQNLKFSAGILEDLAKERGEDAPPLRVGIVTGGFHIPRTRTIMERVPEYRKLDVVFIPAYGPNTSPDNWYKNPVGRSVILSEIRKEATLKNKDYRKGSFR